EIEIGALQQLLEHTMLEFNEDAGWGRQDRQRWTEQYEQLEAQVSEVSLERRRIEQGIEQMQVELKDLRSLLSAGSKLDTVARAALQVELVNNGALARRVELRVDYVVPGAMWRPWHTARLVETAGDKGGHELEFRCDGAVWQATGEDWSDVQLIFSTERPSLGVSPPTLSNDPLRTRRKGATVAVQAREQKVHTAGLGSEKDQRAADELPGIDDGGAVQTLRAAVKTSVPGDGRPHRVPIFDFRSPAEVALVCVPERVPAVLLRSRHGNSAKAPLLAGPVDLVRNSGLVGRSSLLYVAPGERFELGWGP
ncbi:MAG: mucoidy inhibitor MuiA family protein, partial [Myxococcales bacterium]|nr:mucoidy inhibitor MuiA family protein [Myxococcales bacterium]